MKIPRVILLSGSLLAGCQNTPVGQASAPAQPVPAAPAAPVTQAVVAMSNGKVQAFIVAGDVQLIASDGTTAPLKRGQTFEEGSSIKAGSDANVLLVFSNGATLKILGETELAIDKFQQAKFDEQNEGTFLRLSRDPSRCIVSLDLRKGTIQGEFKQPNINAGSTFTINSPAGSKLVQGVFSFTTKPITTPANRG